MEMILRTCKMAQEFEYVVWSMRKGTDGWEVCAAQDADALGVPMAVSMRAMKGENIGR